MTGKFRTAAVALVAAFVPAAVAQAATVPITFSGPEGVSGSLVLTFQPASPTGVIPGNQSPNTVDPIGSYAITDVTGTFSDTTLNLINVALAPSALTPVNYAQPEPTNYLAPHSFSFLKVTNGVDEGNGITSPGLHYDNLYYPGGSPETASDYPFFGGVLDIYGLMFSIGNGKYVNVWSNGVTPGGLNYGVAVTDTTDVLHYVGGVSLATPEPTTWAMMVLGFGLAGAAMRRRRKITATIRFA